MKFILLLLFSFLVGCTITTVDRQGKFYRLSLLQGVKLSMVSMETNGTIILKGYQNDGGVKAAERITAAAVTAAIKASKP
jgi:hypothetical protein